MVEAVVSNGDPEAGYELIQDMMADEQCRPLVNAVIYCSVLKGFSHQKRFDRVWAVYEEMLRHKLQFSIVTFNTLVDACSRSNEMNRIPDLLQSMVSQGIEPNLITYSAILKGYCQENRLEEAFELMEGMLQTTKFKPDEIMYNTLLDGCARQGLYDRGMRLLGEMENVGVRPSNFTLSVLVKMASRSKRLARAFELCEQLSTKYGFRLNVHVYGNLIQACIVHKDNKRAFEVLESLAKDRIRPDVRVYSLLLRACVAAGQAAEAAGLVRAAVGLRGVHPRLMGFDAKLLQPQGGLPPALLSEVLEGISGAPCRDERLAVALLKDLRSKPNVKLDPKLQLRLTAHAMGSPARPNRATQ
jgi:pentatricopeptide repeat protein